ncbi:MAG: flavodoxin domain-containing protein [Pseudomonadota bacterium]|nr:flavodoxin domain-containing protein [Pseudomonadota bacterium]
MTDNQRLLLAIALCLAYCAWVGYLIVSHYARQRERRHVATGAFIVAYASQTGTAKQLAGHQAELLGADRPVKVIALNDLAIDTLRKASDALFVVSTYGDGEPPDNGRRFYRALQQHNKQHNSALLQPLSYRIIALGDSQYPAFCAFGEQLDDALQQAGATAIADLKKVDRAQSQPLSSEIFEGAESACGANNWRVTRQQLLNRADGRELFMVTMDAVKALPVWQAGDILDVQPHNGGAAIAAWLQKHDLCPDTVIAVEGTLTPLELVLQTRQLTDLPASGNTEQHILRMPLLPLRSYSIASVPEEGQLKLIVRKQYHPDGTPGIGSGWLTTYAGDEEPFCAYVKDNPLCHIAHHDVPLVLIGAGSGLAGIRAQLAKRYYANSDADIWLIYGEQSPQLDNVIPAAIETWQTGFAGLKIQQAYSRGEPGQYVQDVMVAAADELQNIIARGAHIYVCGSHQGMGQAVHQTLNDILGEDALMQLIDEQRYHRDTY